MAFVERLVGPDENLVGIARLHWIYAIKGILWFFSSIIIGGSVQTLFAMYVPAIMVIGNAIFGISIFLGILMCVLLFGKMLFTELGLTTERLIYKRGLIFTDVREVDLEEIKSESVDNGALGRILNYGYLDLDARFIEDLDLPAISDPYRFVKAMNAVRSQIKDDNMRVVLDSEGSSAIKTADAIEDHKENRSKPPKTPRGKKNKTQLDDEQFDVMEDSPSQNIKEMAEEIEAPDVFKSNKKQKSDTKPQFQDNREQRKKDLSDMVMDDFEEAEEPKNG